MDNKNSSDSPLSHVKENVCLEASIPTFFSSFIATWMFLQSPVVQTCDTLWVVESKSKGLWLFCPISASLPVCVVLGRIWGFGRAWKGSPSDIFSTCILVYTETAFSHYKINELRNLYLYNTLLSRPLPNKELVWRFKINNSFPFEVLPDLSETLTPLCLVRGEHKWTQCGYSSKTHSFCPLGTRKVFSQKWPCRHQPSLGSTSILPVNCTSLSSFRTQSQMLGFPFLNSSVWTHSFGFELSNFSRLWPPVFKHRIRKVSFQKHFLRKEKSKGGTF